MTRLLGEIKTMKDAMKWWDELLIKDRIYFETKTFGNAEWWEDSSLSENDICKIFIKFGKYGTKV